jgi:hypothetical protein
MHRGDAENAEEEMKEDANLPSLSVHHPLRGYPVSAVRNLRFTSV